jgi:hypothetical protein
MGLRDILNKFRSVFGSTGHVGQKINPNEQELNVYLERERQQRIKQVLDQYRKKERREFLQDNPIGNTFKDNSIITTKQKKTKRVNLLGFK